MAAKIEFNNLIANKLLVRHLKKSKKDYVRGKIMPPDVLMKKFLLLSLFSITFFITQAQTRAGAMVAYGSKTTQIGLGGNLEFFLNDDISISPSLIVYFPESHNNIRDFWFETNLNGNYYFYTKDVFQFYGLAGLNYTFRNHKDKLIDNNSYSSGNLNLNLGGGVNFKFGDFPDLLPFSEIRYVIGSTNQAVVVAGVRFNVGYTRTHR
jgi:outer membrane immunogenic protein